MSPIRSPEARGAAAERRANPSGLRTGILSGHQVDQGPAGHRQSRGAGRSGRGVGRTGTTCGEIPGGSQGCEEALGRRRQRGCFRTVCSVDGVLNTAQNRGKILSRKETSLGLTAVAVA